MINPRVVTCHWPIGMAVALAFAPALAAAADSAATAAYQKERAACLDGTPRARRPALVMRRSSVQIHLALPECLSSSARACTAASLLR